MSNTFNDGTTIATVANMNDLIFRGNIDETEVGRLREGIPVKITLGALQNMIFDAQLEYISPKGVEENGANQFEIKAAITVPDSVTVRSGYIAARRQSSGCARKYRRIQRRLYIRVCTDRQRSATDIHPQAGDYRNE